MATTGNFASGSVGGVGLGASSGAQSGGFLFTAPATGTISQVKITATAVTGAGNWEARLYSNNAGSPGTQSGSSSGSVAISGTGDKTFTFGSPPSMTNTTLYWIIITPVSGTPDFDIDTATHNASYDSGRHNTITSITGAGLTDDIRMEITYSVPAGRSFGFVMG